MSSAESHRTRLSTRAVSASFELALPVGGLAHVIEILAECGLGACLLVHNGGSIAVLFNDSLQFGRGRVRLDHRLHFEQVVGGLLVDAESLEHRLEQLQRVIVIAGQPGHRPQPGVGVSHSQRVPGDDEERPSLGVSVICLVVVPLITCHGGESES